MLKISKGFTFFLPTPPSNIEHRFFVITDPDQLGRVFCANCTGLENCTDFSCVFKKGEHHFFKKDTAINYYELINPTVQQLDSAYNKGILQTNNNYLPPHLIQRIIDGAKKSTALKLKYKKYFP